MKQLIIKMIVVITMIFAGVTGCFAQYHRYHRPYRSYGYYGVYTPSYVYVRDAMGYYPRTVVVERPSYYSTTRTTTKSEKNPNFDCDGVKIERISANRIHIKGGKRNEIIDTTEDCQMTIPTKKGSITLNVTDGKGQITVRHGDQIVETRTL